MNQFFSFNRFSLLVSKHWADNKKRYLLSVIAFMGLLIVWFVFTMLVDSSNPIGKDMQMITYYFLLFVVGSFYANQYFRDLGSRAKGINFLLVPASAFEKILCSLLYTVILFIVVFTAAFYLVDALMVAIAKSFLVVDIPNKEQGLANVFEVGKLPFDGESNIHILLIFFAIQSAFLLGSVYYGKYSFIKTIISGFVVFFMFFCSFYFLYDLMPEGGYSNGFFTSYRINNPGKDDYLVRIPGWLGQTLYYLLMYGIAPFFWIVSYVRLKEKQV
jgi:hypothetical protein